jgi:phosphoribosyl 1,2-cyclic phosphodiesterase
MSADQFCIRFWGVRGSYPVPGPHTLRYGGNTTCVEVQLGQHILIIDAGTGIIKLGEDLVRRARENGNAPIHVTLLLTHMHHDHTQGFPFFLPAHRGSSTLHILGPRTFDEELEETLRHAVLPPNFPVSLYEMPSLKMIRTLAETEIVLIDPATDSLQTYNRFQSNPPISPEIACISVYRSLAHPRNGVYVYRIDWHGKSIVFASDTEGYPFGDQRLARFASNTDVLIHDAQYTQEDYVTFRQGWGHSTPEMACEVAHLSNAQRLVLIHYEPRYSDDQIDAIERAANKLFPATTAAYEGLEIVI